ncbi:MAG: hypothetical protein FVQ80_10680 [Planctomycetes bacterium]|nr:hypothetical protein [Planctomycetota bacterium]
MTEQNQNNNETEPQIAEDNISEELGAAGNSLAEALRISFIILKVIMVVLVIVFLASGFEMLSPDEEAIILKFGKIRGTGENRILGPGPHWVLPYPINEIIKIPVQKKINLPINSFWYYQSKSELLSETKTKVRANKPLNPEIDGYCIIRGGNQNLQTSAAKGSDYNIIHSKWLLTYNIDDPERFFKNVHIQNIKPGQSYADLIEKSIAPLLQHLAEDAIVNAMVHYTIDESLASQDRIPKHVKKLLQQKLDKIESGIVVASMLLTDITWPRQVDKAFQASITASQKSQTEINNAKIYAEGTLNQTAGPVANDLLAMLKNKTLTDTQKQNSKLWNQLAGTSQENIANSKAYKTKVVETARANAEYLKQILPEYRKYPKLVIQKIYQDAIIDVLNNAEEKMIIQPTAGAKGKEIRIQINRDPALKPKGQKKQ